MGRGAGWSVGAVCASAVDAERRKARNHRLMVRQRCRSEPMWVL